MARLSGSRQVSTRKRKGSTTCRLSSPLQLLPCSDPAQTPIQVQEPRPNRWSPTSPHRTQLGSLQTTLTTTHTEHTPILIATFVTVTP
jgi:hypothetical protein